MSGCDCTVRSHGDEETGYDSEIVHCPLHGAAPALLAALEATVPLLLDGWEGRGGLIEPGATVIRQAQDAIVRARPTHGRPASPEPNA